VRRVMDVIIDHTSFMTGDFPAVPYETIRLPSAEPERIRKARGGDIRRAAHRRDHCIASVPIHDGK
jgi:hypothetical protein